MPTAKRGKPKRPAYDPGTLSGQVRAIIERRGLTAYAVATAIDAEPSVISRFLADPTRSLTSRTLDRVAAALGLRLVEGRRGLGIAEKKGRRIEAVEPGPLPAETTRGTPDDASGASPVL